MDREVTNNSAIPSHADQSTAERIIAFLLEVFDPERLSFDTFSRDSYLQALVESIADRFQIDHIVLRHERDPESDELVARAFFGVDEENLQRAMVLKTKGVAKILAEGLSFYHMKDITKDKIYEQKEFARNENINSGLACSIIVQDKFVGFIMYLRKVEAGDFTPREREFLSNELNDIIQHVFLSAEELYRSRAKLLELAQDYNGALSGLRLGMHTAKDTLATVVDRAKMIQQLSQHADFENPLDKKSLTAYSIYVLDSLANTQEHLETSLDADRRLVVIPDVIELIRDSADMLRFLLHDTQLTFDLPSSKYQVSVRASKMQLRQVFFNLLMNAQCAIDESRREDRLRGPGTITIKVSDDKDYVYISISDNGIGMTKEQTANVLLGTGSHWKSRQGTGLGLSLCSTILLRVHRSKIYVESARYKGTTIYIDLRKDPEADMMSREERHDD